MFGGSVALTDDKAVIGASLFLQGKVYMTLIPITSGGDRRQKYASTAAIHRILAVYGD
jgi:hypothetical protein